MAKIKSIKGRQVFDSRGNPTVEAEVHLENNISELLDDQLFEDLDILGPEVKDLVSTNPKIARALIKLGDNYKQKDHDLVNRVENISGKIIDSRKAAFPGEVLRRQPVPPGSRRSIPHQPQVRSGCPRGPARARRPSWRRPSPRTCRSAAARRRSHAPAARRRARTARPCCSRRAADGPTARRSSRPAGPGRRSGRPASPSHPAAARPAVDSEEHILTA